MRLPHIDALDLRDPLYTPRGSLLRSCMATSEWLDWTISGWEKTAEHKYASVKDGIDFDFPEYISNGITAEQVHRRVMVTIVANTAEFERQMCEFQRIMQRIGVQGGALLWRPSRWQRFLEYFGLAKPLYNTNVETVRPNP